MTSGDLLLDRNTFLTRFGASDPSNRVLRRLHALVALDDAAVSDRGVEWLEDVMDWIFQSGRVPSRKNGETELAARTQVLLSAAEEIPAFAARLKRTTQLAVGSCSSTTLFTDTGVPTHYGFWRETVDRVTKNILPPPPVGRDLARLVTRLFGRREVADWFISMPLADRRRFAVVLGLEGDLLERAITPGLKEAALLLSTRAAMQGTSDEVRKRLPDVSVASSPFLELPTQVKSLLAGELKLQKVEATLEACRQLIRRVEGGLDETGISIDLVFRLELTSMLLTRLGLCLTVLFDLEEARELAQVRLERDLIAGTVADRSLGSLWQSSTRLLARRVVERAGHSGENYVTKTRSEQRAMLDAAAGGGAITAVLVFFKFYVAWAKLPPFFDALAVGLNYAWGFVAMQLLHFALATKQPSMTAATIAGAIEEQQRNEENPDLEPLVDLVTRASRTQFTALLGNVFVVIPFCIFVDVLIQLVSGGGHVLDETYAEKVIAAHHPWRSATLYFAAMTGVWLWAASLIAGAVENWFVLRELPGAIASNRVLRGLIGAPRAARVSRFMVEQISGLGGNIGFGLLLGFMPMIFSLVGVPLEVRHVTFVTGQIVYAAVELGPVAFTRPDFLLALLVIPLTGLVNFAVSFALALVVALRARGLGVRSNFALLRVVWARFTASPRDFFLAAPDEESKGGVVEGQPTTQP